jgi:hypothetical protein
VDVVADLLAFVPVNLVLAALEVALDEVTEEAVQLDARMVRGPVRHPPRRQQVGMLK